MKLPLYKSFLCLALLLLFAGFAFAQTERDEGIALFKQGDFKSAVKPLKQATKKDSADAEAWYFLGFSYFKTNKMKESEIAFRTTIKLRPDDSQGYIGLAYFQLFNNKIYEAKAAAEKILELNAQSPEAHHILGLISFAGGSFNAAYERAEKAIKINPNFADAYLLKSEALTSSFGQIRGTVNKSPTRDVEMLKESIANMEKYLSLSADEENKKYHRERLESLRFFAAHYEKSENQIPNNTEFNAAAVGNGDFTPLKITSKPRAMYTDSARTKGVSGTVRLLVGFSEDGKVKYILVLKGLGFGLNEQAIKAAQEIEFEPATKDGKPISVVKQIEYSFLLY